MRTVWMLAVLSLYAQAPEQSRADAAALVKEARALAARGQNTAAIAQYEKALAIHRKFNDRMEIGIVLNNLAAAWWALGENEKALPLFEQAMAVRTELKDSTGVAYTLLGIANVHYSSGELQKALDAYGQALAQWKGLGEAAGQAHAMNNMGLVLQALGRDSQALARHEEAMALFRKLSDRQYEAYTLNNIGMAMAHLGRREEARSRYEQALTMLREAGDRRGQAYVLHNLGDVALEDKRIGDAIEYFRQSLERKRAMRDRYGEAWSLQRLGEAHAARGDAGGAQIVTQQALYLHRSVGDTAGEASALAALGRMERLAGHFDAAEQRLREAIALTEKVRGSIMTPELRGSYFATRQSMYDFLTDLLVEQKKPGALAVAEQSRARLLLDNLAETPAEESLRRAIQAQGQRLQRVRSITEAEAARTRLNELLEQSGKIGVQRRGKPLELSALKGLVTEPGTAIFEYWLGEQRSALFVIGKERIDIHPLPARMAIETEVDRLLRALTARGKSVAGETPLARKQRLAAADREWALAAGTLATVLLPKEALSGVRQVLVTPHRGLAKLPLHVLPGAEGVTFTSIPSASLLPTIQDHREAPRQLVVIASPVPTGDMPPLRFAREEGAAVSALFPAGRSFMMEGARAADSPVLRKAMADAGILHIAAHVVVDDRQPLRSRIMLSGSELDLQAIQGLTLRAELVTLSACRTAVGEELQGEGLLGLTHGFLQAGANRVVATLWDVDDQATAAFMQEFYGNLVRRKMTPAAAMQAARQTFRKHPRWSHPWYWAAFDLYGDWK